jgi:hypothetical protein
MPAASMQKNEHDTFASSPARKLAAPAVTRWTA